jgi:metal transporter CNNM
MKLGDARAKKVYPLRRRGNELLTALLLGNVAVNSIVAVFLGSIASGVVAGFFATALIFLFGEIIPQAVISRHALKFGALTAPFVHILLFVLYPITKPIGLALDKVLGAELQTIYNKKELALLVAEHEDNPHATLDADEERIIHGALKFSDRMALDVMTPRTMVYTLEENISVNAKLLEEIKNGGYSRIPIYKGNEDNMTGFVHVRDLLGAEGGRIGDYMTGLLVVPEAMLLDDLKNTMLEQQRHIAVVMNKFEKFIGLITLEDILEEVIGREIMDEDDIHEDLRAVARRRSNR